MIPPVEMNAIEAALQIRDIRAFAVFLWKYQAIASFANASALVRIISIEATILVGSHRVSGVGTLARFVAVALIDFKSWIEYQQMPFSCGLSSY